METLANAYFVFVFTIIYRVIIYRKQVIEVLIFYRKWQDSEI